MRSRTVKRSMDVKLQESETKILAKEEQERKRRENWDADGSV